MRGLVWIPIWIVATLAAAAPAEAQRRERRPPPPEEEAEDEAPAEVSESDPIDVRRFHGEDRRLRDRDAGATDHDQTRGRIGFQVTRDFALIAPLGPVASLSTIGVRHWPSRTWGWEAGLGLVLSVEGGDPENVTTFGVAATFGVLKTMGLYEHMNVFWGPSLGLLLVAPEDPDFAFQIEAKLSVGTEIRLGMIELPRVGLTTRLSAGVVLSDDGTDLDFLLGTLGGEANSVDGLLAATVGFVFYP